ncbi:uncharacterized protein LOC131245687 [Magnolia sinica]|uniref:uncharacterized protein LOC131245687 n=1 Tax=Magnolia sinica TaxID=86752 RepID=UPI00265A1BB2|nr:uncharacterized protein LOC131245687 [Magnolia sinica]
MGSPLEDVSGMVSSLLSFGAYGMRKIRENFKGNNSQSVASFAQKKLSAIGSWENTKKASVEAQLKKIRDGKCCSCIWWRLASWNDKSERGNEKQRSSETRASSLQHTQMMSTNKVRLLCRFGGNFICESNKVYYKGGTNRIVPVDRAIDYLNLLSKVRGICKLTYVSSIKYKYPSLDLDSLVSIENDDDVSNMMEAFPQTSELIHLYVFCAQNLSIPIPSPSNLMQNADTRKVQASLRYLRGSNESLAPFSHDANANNNDVLSASNDLRETDRLLLDSCVNDMPKTMSILKQDQEFEDANAFDKALREYAIHSNFQYKRTRSSGGHYQAKCIKCDCSWRIHACKLPDKPTFKIKSLKGNHTCNAANESTMPNTTTHRQAGRKRTVASVKDRLQKNLRSTPKDIVDEINREHEIKVSNDKAWRGKELAVKEIHNEQSITTLVMICDEIPTTKTRSTTNLSSMDEPLEDVIYPKGDPDAVSISKRDVELLQPGTFINDTIIDFYLKYLKNKMQHEDKHRFHFFNCFFFRKLADLDNDPGSAKEGKAAFLRVRKWTRRVDIFLKDYIFIPVNFDLHWSLMVICHPGEVAYFKDEEIEKAPKVPCILHMNSRKGTHGGLENLMRSYLWEEWKERQGESSKDVSLKFSNLQFVPPKLPQQENPFDCGLFLLHYVELFLKEAPVNFSPKFSEFLNADWFPPSKASHKRYVIQKLIFELLNDHSLKIPPAACSSQHGSPKFQEIGAPKEQAVEFLFEQCSPNKKRDLGNSFCSTVNGNIEIELLHPSSPRRVQRDEESGITFREFLKQGDIVGSSLDVECELFYPTLF